jgi:hypothetical protein
VTNLGDEERVRAEIDPEMVGRATPEHEKDVRKGEKDNVETDHGRIEEVDWSI